MKKTLTKISTLMMLSISIGYAAERMVVSPLDLDGGEYWDSKSLPQHLSMIGGISVIVSEESDVEPYNGSFTNNRSSYKKKTMTSKPLSIKSNPDTFPDTKLCKLAECFWKNLIEDTPIFWKFVKEAIYTDFSKNSPWIERINKGLLENDTKENQEYFLKEEIKKFSNLQQFDWNPDLNKLNQPDRGKLYINAHGIKKWRNNFTSGRVFDQK